MAVIETTAGTMAPRAVTTTLWAMGSLQHHATQHVARAVARHALAALPILNAHETANVAWACARLQVCSGSFCPSLASAADLVSATGLT